MTLSAKGTKLNRRGLETREQLLRLAIRCLAEGGPDAVSANLVAREAGVTWGTIQHQFGDADGLWAAMLEYIGTKWETVLPEVPENATLAARVDAVVEMLWNALERPASKAVTNLRTALPHRPRDLEAAYPRTASALATWDAEWSATCDRAFDGVLVDRTRLARIRGLLPAALRGLRDEQNLSTFTDVDESRRGLSEAITAYLS
ncbi:TetR/AcrR family transcriptional regulator [Spirillospora sp. NPDC029432]|uniref:TetR/AcrR family transcriptional regulator n=1 Tax=Spirillospora sp. NPDC029432 TaxID=3154599 RepID=UPI003456771A